MYAVTMTLALAMLVGCTAKGTVALKDLPDKWPPIGTTKQEVQNRLGQPSTSSMTQSESGQPEEIWRYEYEEGQENLFLKVVSEIAVSATDLEHSGNTTQLIVTFDQDGNVVGRSVHTKRTGVEPAGPTNEYVQ